MKTASFNLLCQQASFKKNLLLSIFLFTNILLTLSIHAQSCSIAGAFGGTIFKNDSATGTVGWGSPGNAQTSDNNFAPAAFKVSGSAFATTNYLKITGFGFAIPTGSTICGIRAEITHGEILSDNAAEISDNVLRLMKGGVITGGNQASSLAWSGSVVTHPYGGSNDTWNTTWTAEDINSPDFGIAISSVLRAGTDTAYITALIDFVSIAVYYKPAALPVQLIDFVVDKNNASGVDINWTTATESNNKYFAVERSKDDESFMQIKTVEGAGNSMETVHYSSSDENPYPGLSYYRLKQVDFNGASSYSGVRTIYINGKSQINMYPIPAGDKLNVHAQVPEDASIVIELLNMQGQKIREYTRKAKAGINELQLNLDAVEVGLYFMKFSFLSEMHIYKLIVTR